MKNKPLFLKIFPIGALLVAISFPLQIAYLYELNSDNMTTILSMLTPLNLLSILILSISAILVHKMHKSTYIIIPIMFAVLYINNLVVYLYGMDFSTSQILISFVLIAISLQPFYNETIKQVMNDPKQRWWLTPKRYNVRKPLIINSEGFELFSETANISKTGLYATITEHDQLDFFKVDQIIEVSPILDRDMSFKAKVIRIDDQKDGLGLQVMDLKKSPFKFWFKQQLT